MKQFELFTMIFYSLEYYWTKNKNDELGDFLSGMNPFWFEGVGSAVPDIYTDFQKFLNKRRITINNSYGIACEYIRFLDKPYISRAFEWVEEERWIEKCKQLVKSGEGNS